MDSDHRELARRKHRTLAHYLVLRAWAAGAECIILDNLPLSQYLGLQKFRPERLKWIAKDVEKWFPFTKVFYSEEALSCVCLSRTPFKDLPLPTRTESSYLEQNPGIEALKDAGVDGMPDIFMGAEGKFKTWDDWVSDYVGYRKESEYQKIELSLRTLHVSYKERDSFSEENILAFIREA